MSEAVIAHKVAIDFADAWVKEAVTGMVEVDAADGCFPLPNGPGLGVTLNEAFVAEHPPEHAFFDLFADDWHRRQAGAQTTAETLCDGTTPNTDVEVHHG